MGRAGSCPADPAKLAAEVALLEAENQKLRALVSHPCLLYFDKIAAGCQTKPDRLHASQVHPVACTCSPPVA